MDFQTNTKHDHEKIKKKRISYFFFFYIYGSVKLSKENFIKPKDDALHIIYTYMCDIAAKSQQAHTKTTLKIGNTENFWFTY